MKEYSVTVPKIIKDDVGLVEYSMLKLIQGTQSKIYVMQTVYDETGEIHVEAAVCNENLFKFFDDRLTHYYVSEAVSNMRMRNCNTRMVP